MATMYDKLLQLPLFQGLTLNDFTSILGFIKLRFQSFEPGEVIARADDECKRLCFVLDGEVSKTTLRTGNCPLQVEETMKAPYMVELSSLFGKSTQFRSTYRAVTAVNTVRLHKRYLTEELAAFPIVEMNYRNIVSARAQEYHNLIWREPVEGTENRIRTYLLSLVEKPFGTKTYHILRTDLARQINESLSAVSTAVAAMQEQGLITYQRGVLKVPEASLLLTPIL